MIFTNKTLTHLSIGYNLDCGGYEFTNPEHKSLEGCVVWDDPDADYIPWVLGALDKGSDWWGLSCPMYAFRPSQGAFEWPETLPDPDFPRRLLGHGRLYDTDRECYCRGQPEGDEWVPSGDGSGEPYPHCERCEGEGTVDSPGGLWALYTLEGEDK